MPGGRRRGSAGLHIGEHHRINVSPDQYLKTLAEGTDMFDVELIPISHTPEDHFSLPGLTDIQMTLLANGMPLAVSLPKPGLAYLGKTIAPVHLPAKDEQRLRENVRLVGEEY